jgi:hypothetical protein
MSVFALSILGLGDFVSGLVVASAVLLIVGAIVRWRGNADDSRFEDDYLDRYEAIGLVAEGVVICHWVDEHLLQSVARQKKIGAEPVRVEQGESAASGGSVEAGGKGLSGRVSGDRKQDRRRSFEVPADPNALLSDVLRLLAEGGNLLRDLDMHPRADLFDGEVVDRVLEVAGDNPEAQSARDAVRALQQSVLRERKQKEFEDLGGEARFALIDSEWRVSHENGEVWLELTKLRPITYYGDRVPSEDLVEMPMGLSLVVNAAPDKLTGQGKDSLGPQKKVRLSVLGMTASFSPQASDGEHPSRLFITPIAIFSRVQ